MNWEDGVLFCALFLRDVILASASTGAEGDHVQHGQTVYRSIHTCQV